MTGSTLAIGTRGSPLALIQANLVLDAFRQSGQASHIALIETEGDRRAPDTAWGDGAFVAAIEQALLDGHVDVAVHSAKDVPIDGDSRLLIGAYLPRADPRDALVVRADAQARSLDDLPVGSRVGTDSPRRAGFILARRPDLHVHPLHGNVDTRLRRLDTGETDALVLACAGLDRLGLAGRIVERLDPDVVPPAPGQGAIAVQIRCDNLQLGALTAAIDDRLTRVVVETERSFLAAFGGGCRTPIGALASIVDSRLELLGGIATGNGGPARLLRRQGSTDAGRWLADEVARSLGAGAQPSTPIPEERKIANGPRVIVCRAAHQASELNLALRDAGLDPVPIPTIAVELEPDHGGLEDAVRNLEDYGWVVITSANGAQAIVDAGATGSVAGCPRWAAIGPATRAVLETAGITVRLQPSEANGRTIAAELPLATGERVLVVRGDLAGPDLGLALGRRGALVDDVVAYRTREADASSGRLLGKTLADGPIAAVVFTSGSTVRGLLGIAISERLDVTGIPAVCIGPSTAAEATAAGFKVIGVAARPDTAALAAAVAQAVGQR